MPTTKRFNLHLVSDSTGETVSSVARAAMAQFEKIDPEEFMWSLVRTKTQMDKVIAGIQENPGMVLHTLVDDSLREQLTEACRAKKLPCVPVLKNAVSEFATYLRMPIKAQPGRQYELTEEYFSRVEAVNFALTHDDGQATWNLEEADIVLVGPSRTSKSPTCIYLANRGFKAANVPFVQGVPLPDNLETLEHPLVVGLTIDLERLLQIRASRLTTMRDTSNQGYINPEEVEDEIRASRRLFVRKRWPIIDVTRRSVEETAATIIQLYRDKFGTSHPLHQQGH